ncbi:flagellar basal body protein [Sandaracinobacteroides saxicola]|uniref:Flagellar basal body rod protein FlgB n=1 Tax=Sandaracinobacteroides saxicola TaxID=2759707 RepID=A0A7G5IK00_9SPHN|nr:flagellar basal body protein [Sandaracinobacteroides saxicola]QMW23692.1 hypothetical protein H3309_04165 [Sandaracinobacteroides saxicola]
MKDFRNLPLTGGLERAMQHLALRQRVIAENVANASTPGYRTRDVASPDFRRMLNQTARAAPTAGLGIQRPQVAGIERPNVGRQGSADKGHIVAAGGSSEVRNDGNDVSIEAQLLQMADTQSQYATVANLYRRSRQIMRIATGQR